MCRPGFIAPEDCAAWVPTCDAGDCERESVALIRTEDEWLSMCEYCGTSVLIRQATGVRAVKG